jgi:predicted AAA+ superfamily ATPase
MFYYASMIDRDLKKDIETALARQASVALIGPRQVGKTTLALEIAKSRPSIYLDLESTRDRSKLIEPHLFFKQHEGKLVILDEIHRVPEIFQELRGIIDERRRQGNKSGQFLMLGSAAIELLNQSSETLAGRIEYVKMGTLNLLEIGETKGSLDKLWLRGGFPDSFLAANEADSFSLRENFIQTYLERDVPMFCPRIPAETLRRLWTMLAHNQGGLLNASKLASNLAVSSPTITSYIDLLVDLLLVRRLEPYSSNVGKRLVKSPKTYVRDSGLLHALLNIETMDELFSHPVVGASWEGFVIENILSILPPRAHASFYRTAAGAEVDLVIDFGHKRGIWAIEIKRGLSPKIEKGLRHGIADLKPRKSFIVYSGEESYPVGQDIKILSLLALMKEIHTS